MRPPSRSWARPGPSARPPDIYALGAIFYHMLTGRPPFQAATVLGTLEQVKTADPVPPSRLQPGMPRDAETIALTVPGEGPAPAIRRCRGPGGGSRPDSWTGGRSWPVPPGPRSASGSGSGRRPAVALLSSALVAVIVLGFALVSAQWRRAEAEAVAEAAANERAQRARLVAVDKQAQLTLHQALALCDQGEVGRGLSWLARSLETGRRSRVRGPRSSDPDEPGRLVGPTDPTPGVTADPALGADPGPRVPPRGQGARLGGAVMASPDSGLGHRRRGRTSPGARGRPSGRPARACPIRPRGGAAYWGLSMRRGGRPCGTWTNAGVWLRPSRALPSTGFGTSLSRIITI